jgi:hypothetical protein
MCHGIASASDQDGGVVIQSKSDFLKVSGSGGELERRAVIQFNRRPSRGEATFYFESTHYNRLEDIDAKLHRADGSTEKFGKDDFNEIAGPTGDGAGLGMLTDVKTYVRYFDGVEAGDVLEVKSKKKITNLLLCPIFVFQHKYRTQEQRLVVECPGDIEVTDHALGFSGDVAPDVRIDGKKRILTWEFDDVPPMETEARAGVVFPPVIVLRFPGETELGAAVSLDSWNAVAGWYTDLTRVPAEPDAAIERLAERKALNAMTEEQAVRAAYTYVQRDVRYVAIEMGIGAFEPTRASEVAELLYGDCKDKSTLLISLLRTVGITANYVLVRTTDQLPVPENLPSLQFNHVITAIGAGDDRVYLDPTCEGCPYGYLPAGDQGAFALVVEGDRGLPVRLPETTADDNRLTDEITLELDESGDASFKHVRTATGWYGVAIRSFAREVGEKSRDRYFARVYSGIPGIDITGVTIEGVDTNADTVAVIAEGSIAGYAQKAGSFLIVDPDVVSLGVDEPEGDGERKLPYLLGNPTSRWRVVTIRVPVGWTPRLDGELPMRLETDYLRYVHTREPDGSGVRISSEFVYLKNRVAPEQYIQFCGLLRKVDDNENTELVFSNK